MTQELAQSYVEHLRIILDANDRGANLRDFVDPWWCFTRGAPFIRQRRDGAWTAITLNNPCPQTHRERLLHTDWVSESARKAITSGSKDKCLMVDHAIPLKIVREQLFADVPTNMEEFLKTFIKRGTITRTENEKLKASGLNSCMPSGSDPITHPFARYEAADIIGSPESH